MKNSKNIYYGILIRIGDRWQPIFKSDPDKTLSNKRYWIGGTSVMPCIYNNYKIACSERKKAKEELTSKGLWSGSPIIIRELIIQMVLKPKDLIIHKKIK
jgi:hypothetical protein